MKQNKRIVGITGDIASGKSMVSKYLQERGYYVIDADQVARDVLKSPKNLQKLKKVFPEAFDADQLDRIKLGAIVFNNKRERERLNRLMHPMIEQEVLFRIDNHPSSLVFVDAALLYEAGWDTFMDEVLLVWIPQEIQVKRLMERDRISEDYARKKMSSFSGIQDKKKRSIVIDNSNSIENTKRQVDQFLEKYI